MINDFGHKSFITWTRESLEAEKENQMRNFRGLTKNGKWVYGWYMEHPFSDNPKVNCSVIVQNEYPYEVIPETVGQQVGLKDKNGKEAYQGDIVKTKYDTLPPLSIDWRDGGFYYSPAKKDKEGYLFCVCEFVLGEDEIIGTIHTHPELITEKENG